MPITRGFSLPGLSVYDEIAAGMNDAVAHANGDQNAARVHTPPPVVNVKRIRERLGLSQREFSDAIRVPIDTIQNWEQQRRTPQGPALVLLMVLDRNPEMVLQIINGVPK